MSALDKKPLNRLIAAAAVALTAVCSGAVSARESGQGAGDLRPAFSLEGNFLAAYVASAARDSRAASIFYRELFAADPDNIEITERAFVSFLAGGDLDSAFAAAQRIITFDPQNGLAHLALGVKELKAGRYAQSRRHLEQGGRGRAADLTATLLRAWSYAGSRQVRNALDTVDRLQGEPSFELFRNFHGGLIASHLGRPNDAERRLKAALDAQPAVLSVVDAYARLIARRGRVDEAIATYETFLGLQPRNPLVVQRLAGLRAGEEALRPVAGVAEGAAEVLQALGSAGNAQGDELPAIIYLQLALHLNPSHEMALLTLADIYERIERPADALALYERIDPSSPLRLSAEIQGGLALNALERSEEAIARLEALMERHPDDMDVIMSLANLLRTQERFGEAAEIYGRAVALIETADASHWPLFFFRGAAYERSKQWPLAEADLKMALSLVPDSSPIGRAQVLNYLGYSWVDMGINIDEAFEMLQEAVSLSPRDGMIIDSLGWAFYRMGRYEEAVRELERAVELKPADPVINDHLGDAYWKVGRRLEATFQWRHALDNDPDPDARLAIERKLVDGLDLDQRPAAAEAVPVPGPIDANGG